MLGCFVEETMTKQDMARALVGSELFDRLVAKGGLASALRAAEVRLYAEQLMARIQWEQAP